MFCFVSFAMYFIMMNKDLFQKYFRQAEGPCGYNFTNPKMNMALQVSLASYDVYAVKGKVVGK